MVVQMKGEPKVSINREINITSITQDVLKRVLQDLQRHI